MVGAARTVVWVTVALGKTATRPPCFGGKGTSHSRARHHKRVIFCGHYQIADKLRSEFGPLPLKR